MVYLDGNSLGPLPRSTPARLAEVARREWGKDLIASWNDNGWMEAPARIGGKIAPLIGAGRQEVVAGDSTSINLFKLAAAALMARPGRNVVLSEPGNFPTDLYMVEGLRRLLPHIELRLVPRGDIEAALDEDVALLLLTHVHYKTAEMFDMAALTAAAHRVGALALWDLSHSAGAVPVDLGAARADFAVGCGYKYLNGGPGAPAFLYVAERHRQLASPLPGWMGHAAPFDFEDAYRPAGGIERWRAGTPPILSLAALEEGVELMREAPFDALVEKSRALSGRFIELVEASCPDLALISPRDPTMRGSHVSFAHAHGYEIMQALIAQRIVGDFRAPDALRFGFAPLYLRYADLDRAAGTLADILESERWREPGFAERKAVT